MMFIDVKLGHKGRAPIDGFEGKGLRRIWNCWWKILKRSL